MTVRYSRGGTEYWSHDGSRFKLGTSNEASWKLQESKENLFTKTEGKWPAEEILQPEFAL
jgi:hypothetical protein